MTGELAVPPDGAPAPAAPVLPDRLADETRDLLFGARQHAEAAARAAEQATGAYRFLHAEVGRRYRLGDGDVIEDDGRITRAPGADR